MKKTALFSILFLVGATSAFSQLKEAYPSNIVCRTEDGYEIRRDYLLLEEGQFTEERLRAEFARFVPVHFSGEWYLIVSSDPEFFRSKAPAGADRGWSVTSAPVAYYFRIGGNEFFQFGREGGEVRWVTRRGENLFNRTFGRTQLTLVGQDFTRLASDWECSEVHRTLVFIAPDLHEPDLESIARFYSRVARVDNDLQIRIEQSARDAARFTHVRFPMLEAMECFRLKLAGELPSPPGPLRSYTFVRLSRTRGELLHYDRAGPGGAKWVRQIELKDLEEQTDF